MVAIESLIGFRKYADAELSSALRGRIESVKREMVIADDALKTWINCCAAATMLFALSALCWAFYATLDQTCLGRRLSLFVTLLHFAPLPVVIAILYLRSCFVYRHISAKVESIKQAALS